MNFALSDEQSPPARRPRAARCRATRPSRPPARRSTAASCWTCGPPPARPAGPACWSPTSTAARGSARSTRCSFSANAAGCWPASAARPSARHQPARRRRGRGPPGAGRRRAACGLPAYVATRRRRGGLDGRGRVGPRARTGAACTAGPRRGERQRPLVLGARRARRRRARRGGGERGRTAGRHRGAGGRPGRGGRARAPLRRYACAGPCDAEWCLGRGARRGRDRAGRRVVPGRRPARRRVGGQRGDRLGGIGRVRQGALHVRARDRLLPGGQARPDRGAAPAGERALAALLRRLGASRTPPTSSRWPPAPRGRWPVTRWTSQLAR